MEVPFSRPAVTSRAGMAPADAAIDPMRLTARDLAGAVLRVANPLQESGNLRDFYDRFRGSPHGYERAAAIRAWSACFPHFMDANGRTLGVDDAMRGLGADAAKLAVRRSAYAELRARCQGFFSMSRDEMLALTRQHQDWIQRGEALEPGELATHFLAAGDSARSQQIAVDALASGDAYALASMREFLFQRLTRQVDAQTLPASTRADLQSLALLAAACQRGLDCSAHSLEAVQLCAFNGLCEGDLIARSVQGFGQTGDAERFAREVQRTEDALDRRDLRALHLVD